MQVLALTLMEPPATVEGDVIRDEKVKLLAIGRRRRRRGGAATVVRGQYGAGSIDGEPVPAYRDEPGVDPTLGDRDLRRDARSTSTTGVGRACRSSSAPASGCRERATEVAMVFQRPPHLPFAGKLARDLRPDSLTLRIQPDEGISLSFGAKVPGPTFRVRNVSMDFSYSQSFPGQTVDAYDRLLLDAMVGDPTLFIRDDEVHRAWAIVAPVQRAFAETAPPLAPYRAGAGDPKRRTGSSKAAGRRWRTDLSRRDAGRDLRRATRRRDVPARSRRLVADEARTTLAAAALTVPARLLGRRVRRALLWPSRSRGPRMGTHRILLRRRALRRSQSPDANKDGDRPTPRATEKELAGFYAMSCTKGPPPTACLAQPAVSTSCSSASGRTATPPRSFPARPGPNPDPETLVIRIPTRAVGTSTPDVAHVSAIAAASVVVITVIGAEKAAALSAVQRGDDLPVGRVRTPTVI